MNLTKEKIQYTTTRLESDENYDSQRLQEIYNNCVEDYKKHPYSKDFDYCGWTIRASIEYNFGETDLDFDLAIYRWETNAEFNERYKRVSEAQKKAEEARLKQEAYQKVLDERKQKLKEAEEKKQAELLKDPDYLKALELKKKYNL